MRSLSAVCLLACATAAAQDVPGDAVIERSHALAPWFEAVAIAGADVRSAERTERVRALQTLVRGLVEPADARFMCAVAERAGGPVLHATATRAQHAWIKRFLLQNREAAAGTLVLDVHYYRAGSEVEAKHLASWLEGAVVGPSPGTKVTPGWTRYQLPRGVPRGAVARLEEVGSLRLSTTPVASADADVGQAVSYIRDFIVERNETSMIVDPVIDVARVGLSASAGAGFVAPGTLGVLLRVQHLELEHPIASKKVRRGLGNVTIQMPVAHAVTIEVTERLASGAAALYLMHDAQGRVHVVTLARVAR